MAEKTVPEIQSEKTPIRREVTRHPDHYVTPLVDIYDSEAGLVVVADMPGVEKEDLVVKVDEGLLTLEGHMKPLKDVRRTVQEFDSVRFFRQFELPEEIDQERIGAEFKHGVLHLTLPRLEKKPARNIQVDIR